MYFQVCYSLDAVVSFKQNFKIDCYIKPAKKLIFLVHGVNLLNFGMFLGCNMDAAKRLATLT